MLGNIDPLRDSMHNIIDSASRIPPRERVAGGRWVLRQGAGRPIWFQSGLCRSMSALVGIYGAQMAPIQLIFSPV